MAGRKCNSQIDFDSNCGLKYGHKGPHKHYGRLATYEDHRVGSHTRLTGAPRKNNEKNWKWKYEWKDIW